VATGESGASRNAVRSDSDISESVSHRCLSVTVREAMLRPIACAAYLVARRARSVALLKSGTQIASGPFSSSFRRRSAWKICRVTIVCSADAACQAAEKARPSRVDVMRQAFDGSASLARRPAEGGHSGLLSLLRPAGVNGTLCFWHRQQRRMPAKQKSAF
ncbi:hypothetical protein PO909_023423, partial [Leuciscus waleckii]